MSTWIFLLVAIIEGRRVFKTITISVIFEVYREDYKIQSRDDMIPLNNVFISKSVIAYFGRK